MISIVITTINIPKNVKALSNIAKSQKKELTIIIVTDKKTPSDINKIKKYQNSFVEIVILNLKLQKEFKLLNDYLPYNSIQRRNIGYLYAIKNNFQTVITMDDDNFPLNRENERNFFNDHSLFKKKNIVTVNTKNKWMNVCDFLKTSDNRRFYHRGHPILKRFDDNLNEKKFTTSKFVKISANAGLWLVDPDIDSFERLTQEFKVIGKNPPLDKNKFLVPHKSTYSVFNSQNTSFTHSSLFAYFLLDIGDKPKTYLASHHNFRYDDIWASIIFQKISKLMNYYVSYGKPYVYQIRNPHNFKQDVCREHIPLMMTDKFADIIISLDINKSSTFLGTYENLINKLEKLIKSKKLKLNSIENEIFKNLLKGAYKWIKSTEKYV